MQHIMDFIHNYQYIGVFFIQSLGVLGIPLPDDSTLVLLGYLVHKNVLRFEITVAAAFLGNAFGSTIGFFLGRTFGLLILSKYGSRIGLTHDKIEKTHKWFKHFGKWLLSIGYFIPGVRHVMCYLAGASELEYPVFALFAYAGSLIWTLTFIYAGTLLGDNWARMVKEWDHYLVPGGSIVIVLGLIIYFVWQYRKNKRKVSS